MKSVQDLPSTTTITTTTSSQKARKGNWRFLFPRNSINGPAIIILIPMADFKAEGQGSSHEYHESDSNYQYCVCYTSNESAKSRFTRVSHRLSTYLYHLWSEWYFWKAVCGLSSLYYGLRHESSRLCITSTTVVSQVSMQTCRIFWSISISILYRYYMCWSFC